MIDLIKKVLLNHPELSGWVLEVKSTRGVELFYVLDHLETNRAINTQDYSLTIYRNFKENDEEFLGSATLCLFPYMNEESLEKVLNEAYENCLLVKNKKFALAIPSKINTVVTSNMLNGDLALIASKVSKAVFKANTFKEGWINSTEIFIYNSQYQILNSKGIEYCYTKATGEVEIIPTWKNQNLEVELYKDFKFINLDEDKITKEVNDILEESRNRSVAGALKNHKLKVLLRASEAKNVLWYFANELTYSKVYSHINQFNVGDDIQKRTTGDKLTIALKPYLASSYSSMPFDKEGNVLKDLLLVKDSIALDLWGSLRYASYLNLECNGVIPNISVAPGSVATSEMKSEPYLEIVSYSAMQMEPFSGYFGGEVRLAYYYDGKTVMPVTGITVSGNIHEVKQTMKMAKEITQCGNYEGPEYIEFDNMTIL